MEYRPSHQPLPLFLELNNTLRFMIMRYGHFDIFGLIKTLCPWQCRTVPYRERYRSQKLYCFPFYMEKIVCLYCKDTVYAFESRKETINACNGRDNAYEKIWKQYATVRATNSDPQSL